MMCALDWDREGKTTNKMAITQQIDAKNKPNRLQYARIGVDSNTNSNNLLGYCVQVENSRACKCFPFPLQISLSVIEIAVSDF